MNKYLEKIAEQYVAVTTKPRWSNAQLEEYNDRKTKRKYGAIAGAAGILGASGSSFIKNPKLSLTGAVAGVGSAVGATIYGNYQHKLMRNIFKNPAYKSKSFVLDKTKSLEDSLNIIRNDINGKN